MLEREGGPEIAVARGECGPVDALIDERDDERCRNAPQRKDRRSRTSHSRIWHAADCEQPGKHGERQQVRADQDRDARQHARAKRADARPLPRHGKRRDPERRRRYVRHHDEGFEDDHWTAGHQRRRGQRRAGPDQASTEPVGCEHEECAAERHDEIGSTGRERCRERHQQRQARRHGRAHDAVRAEPVGERHE